MKKRISDDISFTYSYEIVGHINKVNSVDISENRYYIISGSSDYTAKIWDLKSLSEVTTLRGHTDIVTSVAVSEENGIIATASRDKTIKLWDINSFNKISEIETASVPRQIKFFPDGNHIIAAGEDGSINAWDIESKKITKKFLEHSGSVNCIDISKDGNFIVSTSNDKTIKVWDWYTSKEIKAIKTSFKMKSIILFGGDKYIVAGGEVASLLVFDLPSGEKVLEISEFFDFRDINSVSVLHNGDYICCGNSKGKIKIYRIDIANSEYKKVFSIESHKGSVNSIIVLKESSSLISAGDDGRIFLYSWG